MRIMHVLWSSRARVGLIAVLLLVLLSSSRALLGRDATPVTIRVVPVHRGDLTVAVTATGTVQPARTVDIKYDGQDFVDGLFVREGQTVHRGQALARMNTQLLSHTRNQASQLVARDDANLALAEATLRRSETLLASQLIARADLDSARASYDALRHQRDGDRQALLETDTQIGRATLRSPLDGVVTQLYVHDGEMLGSAAAVTSIGASATAKPTNVLMTIAQGGALEVWAAINAIDLGRVHTGQAVQMTIDAFRPALFTGDVRQIGLQPTVINNVTTYEVRIAVATQDPRWRIGLPVNVLLPTTVARDASIVPLAAVITRDGHDAVRVVADNRCDRGLVERPVRIVARNAQAAAIDGVRPGDLVVASNTDVASQREGFACVTDDFQANSTLDTHRATTAADATVKTGLITAGPPSRGLLQRMFGM